MAEQRSRNAVIELDWADGEHTFRLAIGQLRELQEKCNAGPAEIIGRFRNGTWRVDDIREVIRLGLIGGGMAPIEALKLVRKYVDERPWMESLTPAQAILLAALVGPVEEKPTKKAQTAKVKTGESSSPLPTSTGQAH